MNTSIKNLRPLKNRSFFVAAVWDSRRLLAIFKDGRRFAHVFSLVVARATERGLRSAGVLVSE